VPGGIPLTGYNGIKFWIVHPMESKASVWHQLAPKKMCQVQLDSLKSVRYAEDYSDRTRDWNRDNRRLFASHSAEAIETNHLLDYIEA